MKGSLLPDIGLAMLIALPAIAPAEPSPRTVEPAEAIAAGTAEPAILADALDPPRLGLEASL